MDCRKCAEDMTAFIDGELPKPDTVLMQSHINNCPACAGEYAGLREAAHLVESHHRRVSLEPGSWNLVRARIGQLEPAPRPGLLDFMFRRRWYPAIATGLGVVGLGLGIWSYYSYYESERALRRYMSEYVQARETEDQRRRLPVIRKGEARFEYLDTRGEENPFVVVSEISEDNPFRR